VPSQVQHDDRLLNERLRFEDRLGHYACGTSQSMNVARYLIGICLRYIDEKALHLAPRRRRAAFWYGELKKIMQPIPLPFAGRMRNAREWMCVFRGQGNLRELLGTVWLFARNILSHDLVGRRSFPEAIEIGAQAGFDVSAVKGWIDDAIGHAGHDAVQALDPKMDLFRMPWHRTNRLHHETCIIPSWPPPTSRFWSHQTRLDFIGSGGQFSAAENEYSGPAGKDKVPWLDARRYCQPNMEHPIVAAAARNSIPMRTGISRASMQLAHCGRLLAVENEAQLRFAIMGYLLSVRAHSLYEIAVGLSRETVALEDICYDESLFERATWPEIGRNCGSFPSG